MGGAMSQYCSSKLLENRISTNRLVHIICKIPRVGLLLFKRQFKKDQFLG